MTRIYLTLVGFFTLLLMPLVYLILVIAPTVGWLIIGSTICLFVQFAVGILDNKAAKWITLLAGLFAVLAGLEMYL